jgi:hypothetical protein
MDRRLWFGVAAIALLAGLVAVLAFTGGDADATPLAYEVDWPVEQGPATVREGQLEEGRNETHKLELDRANVTRVTVRLDWTDDVGQPDEFRLWAAPPNGTPKTNASRNETVELTFAIDTPPELATVQAVNRSQARERLADRASQDGQGTWTVRVTLEDAPGRRPVAEAPDLETEPDGANSYNLTFAHHVYFAKLGDPAPPEPDG